MTTRTAPPADGVHPNIPEAEYRKWDAYNHSALCQFHRSAAHVREALDGVSEPTDAMEFGSAFHIAVLERERFASAVALEPKFAGTGSVAARKAWNDANAGRIVIPEAKAPTIAAMIAAVRSNPECRKLAATKGLAETCVVWTDKATGLRCKGRVDKWYKDFGLFADLKTTEDASERKFTRSVIDYWYWTQSEFYRMGFEALGYPVEGLILAVEKKPPHGVAVYSLSPWAEVARKQIRNWLAQAAVCEREGKWPGYTVGAVPIDVPNWLEKQWETFGGDE